MLVLGGTGQEECKGLGIWLQGSEEDILGVGRWDLGWGSGLS